MALSFGKKKGGGDASPEPAAAPTGATDDFDLSSFADVLETTGGSTAEDDSLGVAQPLYTGDPADGFEDDATMILNAPAAPGPATASAFDWSEESLLGDLTNSAPAAAADPDPFAAFPASETTPFDAGFEFDPHAFPTTEPAGIPEATGRKQRKPKVPRPPMDVSVPTGANSGKKPKVPIVVGLVVLLLAAGGGAYMHFNSAPSDDEIGTPALTPVPGPDDPAAATPAATTPSEVKPDETAPKPGEVAPKPGEVAPKPGAAAAAVKPGKPGVKPAPPAPASPPPAPAVVAQLKKLWDTGADAKHKGDEALKKGDKAGAAGNYALARGMWQQALALAPGHPGFQESIDKLPK